MIVKILGTKTTRYTDCDSAIIKVGAIDIESKAESFTMVCSFSGRKDIEILLCKNDQIYYLNDSGKTIDKDFSMLS